MQSLIDAPASSSSLSESPPVAVKAGRADSTAEKNNFQSIQVTRGIAALIVVWLHLGQTEVSLAAQLPRILTPFVYLGHAGVDAFFIVSGFVLTSSHWNEFGKNKVLSFLLKRLIRVYPYYMVTCIPYLVVTYAQQHYLSSKIVASLFLIPRFANIINPVAWSLAFEIMFYAVLACFLPFKKAILFPGVALWVLAVVVYNVCFPGFNFHDNACAEYILHPISIEFMAGVLLAALVKRGITIPAIPTMFVGAIWLTVGCLMRHPGGSDDFIVNGWRCVWYGVPCFLLVYGLIATELNNVKLRFPKALLVLGDASYSIYLLHLCLIVAIKPWFTAQNTPFACIAASIVCALLIPAVCIPAYYLVEKPLLNLFRQMLRKAKLI